MVTPSPYYPPSDFYRSFPPRDPFRSVGTAQDDQRVGTTDWGPFGAADIPPPALQRDGATPDLPEFADGQGL